MAMMQGVQKNTLYVGGLAEEVNELILHAAFIPFGDIKDVKTPLDQVSPFTHKTPLWKKVNQPLVPVRMSFFSRMFRN